MAKWGEGDPRWIVEDRPDAVNVNNWHWVEKNADSWSTNKLKELFVGLKVTDSDGGWCEVTDLTTTEGHASITNRKGRLGFFYDWQLKGNWQGKLSDGQKKIKGKFEVPHIGEEDEPDEIVLDVSLDKESDEGRKVKDIMRIQGLEAMKKQVAKYITDLKEEYSQGVILPSKNASTSNKVDNKNKENVAKQEMNKVVESTSSKPAPVGVGVKIPTSTVILKETFRCTTADLYRALTVKEMVQVYTGSDSVIDATKGGRFALLGGNVLGEYTTLVPNSQICMRWRMKCWPEEHYSIVTIDLEEKEGETTLSLKQTGVPEREVERTREGWKANFWERMKQIFGFSSRLF